MVGERPSDGASAPEEWGLKAPGTGGLSLQSQVRQVPRAGGAGAQSCGSAPQGWGGMPPKSGKEAAEEWGIAGSGAEGAGSDPNLIVGKPPVGREDGVMDRNGS